MIARDLLRTLVIALGISLCGVTAAFAITAEEVHACFPDAVRLCSVSRGARNPSFAEKMRVFGCMLLHRDQLGPRCRAVFRAHGI